MISDFGLVRMRECDLGLVWSWFGLGLAKDGLVTREEMVW